MQPSKTSHSTCCCWIQRTFFFFIDVINIHAFKKISAQTMLNYSSIIARINLREHLLCQCSLWLSREEMKRGSCSTRPQPKFLFFETCSSEFLSYIKTYLILFLLILKEHWQFVSLSLIEEKFFFVFFFYFLKWRWKLEKKISFFRLVWTVVPGPVCRIRQPFIEVLPERGNDPGIN